MFCNISGERYWVAQGVVILEMEAEKFSSRYIAKVACVSLGVVKVGCVSLGVVKVGCVSLGVVKVDYVSLGVVKVNCVVSPWVL